MPIREWHERITIECDTGHELAQCLAALSGSYRPDEIRHVTNHVHLSYEEAQTFLLPNYSASGSRSRSRNREYA